MLKGVMDPHDLELETSRYPDKKPCSWGSPAPWLATRLSLVPSQLSLVHVGMLCSSGVIEPEALQPVCSREADISIDLGAKGQGAVWFSSQL